MRMIRSLTVGGQLFEIRPKYVRQLVPSMLGLTVLITASGSRFVLTEAIADLLRQNPNCFTWDKTSQTFVLRG